MRKYYVYDMPPTDWFFPFKTMKETIEYIISDYCDDIEASRECLRLLNIIDAAKKAFRERAGWEGDGNIYISGLPHNDGGGCPLVLVMIKQSNNGTTFLYSPVELPHLEEWLSK